MENLFNYLIKLSCASRSFVWDVTKLNRFSIQWGGSLTQDWCVNKLALCCTGGRNHLRCEGAHHGGQSATGWEREPPTADPGGRRSANWKHPEAIRLCNPFQLPCWFFFFWVDGKHHHIIAECRFLFGRKVKFKLLQSDTDCHRRIVRYLNDECFHWKWISQSQIEDT